VFDAWFSEHGFTVQHLPEGMHHEGAGDALFCGDALFAGYRIRSDVRGHQWLGQTLGVRVLPLELVDPHFYHLDTCFCPLAPGLAIWHPPAFDAYGQRVIETHVPNLIPAIPDEANRFGCNAVVVGKTVVLNAGCPRLADALADHGYEPVATPLDEFLKAGGSAKCLTLRLDGEDAAGWRIDPVD
jgi:N-dimethylarginine dimethylaminohydrolase